MTDSITDQCVNDSADDGAVQSFWPTGIDTGGHFDHGDHGRPQPANDRPVEKTLSRLSGVKSTGTQQWIACCPAHDDGRPSLSVKETSDGTLLLHCFALCEPVEVVEALGLRMADLFVDTGYSAPCGPRDRRIPPQDALRAIDHEALIAATIISDVYHHGEVSTEVLERLNTACARIGSAREVVR
ncbi:hypothetical protein [Salinisphaera orenii]|uniref:hypothetical protein n=1 Tax=Salinisphaera orenii TaxID=856731 RepID=UPI000DBE8EE9